MKLGFSMPNMIKLNGMSKPWEASVTGPDQLRLARWADKLGFAEIAVPEHYIIPNAYVPQAGPHHLSAYAGMAAYAGATENIRVNSCIALLPVLNPIITAKILATMDWITGGRVTITFAVGWCREEYDMLGVPFNERGARSDEYLQAIIALWTQENPAFEGKYVSFRDVTFEPKPVQNPHPPIWMGGDADPVLKRTARFATGWWPAGTRPEDLPARIDFIKSQPDYGGQLTDVCYGFNATFLDAGKEVVSDSSGRAGMTKDQIIDRMGWYRELGVTITGMPIPDVGGIEEYMDYTQWLAEEIVPAIA
ncbi:MAG: TIGR03619 family F420-dependent LLM class oxidoreductase [Novosphingobium sp.]